MEKNKSIGNNLEVHLSGWNEGPTVVVVIKSCKSSSCDDDVECKEQVGDVLVANEEAIRIPAKYEPRLDWWYPKKM